MTVTKENNIKLEFSPKEDFKVRCDSDRIIQVVNNLIGNAIKFVSKKEGLIQIKTKSEDNMCIVSVSDNGIGIAKDLQPNLFQKFYQVDTSLTRKSGGTGLGLAICKGIVTSHNGKIWLKSNKGEGCTFYFSLPMEPDQI